MSNKYYTKLTTQGIQKQMQALRDGSKITLKKIVVAEGTEPLEMSTTNIEYCWSGEILKKSLDDTSPNRLILEARIKADDKKLVKNAEGVYEEVDEGFFVRQIGVYDDKNTLFAVGVVPESYKPKYEGGVSKDYVLRIFIELSDTDTITINLSSSADLVTQTELDTQLKVKSDKESVYTKDEVQTQLTSLRTELSQAIESVKKDTSFIGDIEWTYRKTPKEKWVFAYGGEFEKEDYPELISFINEHDLVVPWDDYQQSIATHGACGFFSYTPNETHFLVPSLHSTFVKSITALSRKVGSIEPAQTPQHKHALNAEKAGRDTSTQVELEAKNDGALLSRTAYIQEVTELATLSANQENRPKNIGLRPMIKVKA